MLERGRVKVKLARGVRESQVVIACEERGNRLSSTDPACESLLSVVSQKEEWVS